MVRSAYSVVCGFMNHKCLLPPEKLQGHVSQKITPNCDCFSMVQSFRLAVYLTGSQARVDLVLKMRRYQMCDRTSFAVHENQPQ
jgi:hypothetical protein